jgi:hypothetical protein
VVKNLICIDYVGTEDQKADFLTKALSSRKLEKVRNEIGLHEYRSREGVGVGSNTNEEIYCKSTFQDHTINLVIGTGSMKHAVPSKR